MITIMVDKWENVLVNLMPICIYLCRKRIIVDREFKTDFILLTLDYLFKNCIVFFFCLHLYQRDNYCNRIYNFFIFFEGD